MDLNEDALVALETTLGEINDFLKQHLWCDFSIVSLSHNLVIGGSTSFSEKYDIEITFGQVFFTQCLSEWKTEPREDVFMIPTQLEQFETNGNFGIEQGNVLIKILAEDIKSPMIVACRTVEYKLFDKNNGYELLQNEKRS